MKNTYKVLIMFAKEDAIQLEKLLNEGWKIDKTDACGEFIIYILI